MLPLPTWPKRFVALPKQWRRWQSIDAHSQNVRPATAPKQYPDTRGIRNDPDLHARNAELRKYDKHKDNPYEIVRLSERVQAINTELKEPRSKLRSLEKQFAAARSQNEDGNTSEIFSTIKSLRQQVNEGEEEARRLETSIHTLALSLPNLTSHQTPTHSEPKVLKYLNYNPDSPPSAVDGANHSAIGQDLGILDFASASTAAGWGFYYLLDEAVLLEQALIQYATTVALDHGWRLVTPPSLVYSHIAHSCGFQPRDVNDEQQIWQIAQPEKEAGKPRRSLAATAEIPLAALYAGKAIPENQLPLKFIGTSRCYRAEAGARGVDTKGLYRVHEFTKVEMFAWTDAPEREHKGENVSEEVMTRHSTKVFDEMVSIQCEILSSLGLPCRVLEMPAIDMGASAFRKIDIEAFFPSRKNRDQGWGELTSVSICTDYQSRRLDTRIQTPSGKKEKFPHTINGTAMAIPRVMACILENGFLPQDRSVSVPKVLRPLMGGLERIGPRPR